MTAGDGLAARLHAAETYAALLLRERDEARARADDLAALLAEVHRLAPPAVTAAAANREGLSQ